MTRDASRAPSLTVRRAGPHRLLLAGELDACGAPVLVATVLDECRHQSLEPLELDCSGVRFIDASGVSALIVSAAHARRSGRRLRLVRRSRCVDRLLELCALSDV
jgi:anti-anti-sigma factor